MAEENKFKIYIDVEMLEEFKNFDSQLIQDQLKKKNITYVSFDVKYRDVFEIIRFNNLVNIDNDNFDNTTNIYLGLLYFKNVRILKDLETKIVKYIK